MPKNTGDFDREHLEQQIKHPADFLEPEAKRLLEDLQWMYSLPEQERGANTASLQRVQRLLEARLQLPPQKADETVPHLSPLPLKKRHVEKNTFMEQRNDLFEQTMSATRGQKQRSVVRLMGILAAALVGVVLVGSLLLVFNAQSTQRQTHVGSPSHQSSGLLPAPSSSSGAAGLYVISNGLYRLDAATGKKLWFYNVKGVQLAQSKGPSAYLQSTVTTGGGEVYVAEYDFANGAYDPFIDALDAATGHLLWHLPLPHAHAPTAFQFTNDTLYVSADTTIYAMGPRTGAILWSASVGGRIVSVDHGIIYGIYGTSFGEQQASLFALRASDGAQLWQHHLSGLQSEPQGVSFVNGVLYVSASSAAPGQELQSAPNYVLAYSASNGQQVWKSAPISGLIDAAPSAANGLVYVGAENHQVYALNASDGKVRWQHDAGGAVAAPTYVVGNTLIVGTFASQTNLTSNGQILAYNAITGAPKWTQPAQGFTGTHGTFDLAVTASTVYYVSAQDRGVHLLNLENGNPQGQFKPDMSQNNNPSDMILTH